MFTLNKNSSKILYVSNLSKVYLGNISWLTVAYRVPQGMVPD